MTIVFETKNKKKNKSYQSLRLTIREKGPAMWESKRRGQSLDLREPKAMTSARMRLRAS